MYDLVHIRQGPYNITKILQSPCMIVTVDKSVREDERSNDEEKDENVKGDICQLLDQRTASQRRDKSCAPSH